MVYNAQRNDKRAKTTDADFINLFQSKGPRGTANYLKTNVRNVYKRRITLERLYQTQITAPQEHSGQKTRFNIVHPHCVQLEIKTGIALIGSDAHIWPGPMSTAMRAFIKFCKDMRPAAVILNGDVMDFPRISRHPPIGWENQPTVQDEIEAAQDQLHKIELAAFKARKVWTLGNHCERFETRLATVAPEYARVNGVHLRDHFPNWEPGWNAHINNQVFITHSFRSGMHAPHNNTLWAGQTTITGHLHSQKVMPVTDLNGTRWGVDSGCLADTEAKAFVDYTRGNPKNWRAGFVVLTFVDGALLPPELVSVWDLESVVFRGEIIHVPQEAQPAPRVGRGRDRGRSHRATR